MQLTAEQLKEISDCAELFLSVADIAVLIGVDANMLRMELACPESAAARAYSFGKATGRRAVAKATRELLNEGNAAALQQTQEDFISMQED